MLDLSLWHYPRPALAKSYLAALKSGIAVSTTIFAPRRMGKTTFLRKDLTPLARKQGFIVVYADLWQTRQSPVLALTHALEQALEPKTLGARLKARLNTPVKTVKAGAEIGGAKLSGEIGLDVPQKESAEAVLRIGSLLSALCEKGIVLLLIDEAQELARTRENENVATALRTAITLNQDKLRVVFTGSSRTRLASVFSDSKAPLYSSGVAITDFPLLDRDFVDFILEKFKAASGNRSVDPDSAWQAFNDFERQPEPFLKCIFLLLINPGMKLAAACRLVQEERLRDENHEGVWATMDATQKALVRLLAEDGTRKPFSVAVIAELRRQIGVDTLQKTHVQRAIGKLTEAGVLTREAGDGYAFENPAFKTWVQTLADQ